MTHHKKVPAPVPPGVFESTIDGMLQAFGLRIESPDDKHKVTFDLANDYRVVWRDSLTSPSGQHLNVKVPTTDPTRDTYLNNESTRYALSEAFTKLAEAAALVRSARGMVSNRRESFDPKRKHKAEGSGWTEQELAESEGRARAKPSRRWERTG